VKFRLVWTAAPWAFPYFAERVVIGRGFEASGVLNMKYSLLSRMAFHVLYSPISKDRWRNIWVVGHSGMRLRKSRGGRGSGFSSFRGVSSILLDTRPW